LGSCPVPTRVRLRGTWRFTVRLRRHNQ
jgi:hypothetical protein